MLWINDIVTGINESYLTNSPYELCRYLDIRIEKVEPTYYLLKGKNSIYFRNFYSKEVIFIRNDLYGEEEEFDLRHELGHALLHTHISSSAHINIGKLEKQANYFALALSGITFDCIDLEGMTLRQIASCLEVPYEPLLQLVNL
jgi:Zn-dependent peptidase ImmA (M78 family)